MVLEGSMKMVVQYDNMKTVSIVVEINFFLTPILPLIFTISIRNKQGEFFGDHYFSSLILAYILAICSSAQRKGLFFFGDHNLFDAEFRTISYPKHSFNFFFRNKWGILSPSLDLAAKEFGQTLVWCQCQKSLRILVLFVHVNFTF